MEEEHMKQVLKVNTKLIFFFKYIFHLDYAAETNATHGIPVEDFQQIVLNQHNIYRREMCANDLENDENLHRIAEQRVHNKANGKEIPLPDDYNENVYIHDTGDPSKITGENNLLIFLGFFKKILYLGEMIVKFWYDQRQKYDIHNESSATDFTQLVWKKSNKIGVGHAYNGHKLYVIVLYKPSGNIRGQFATNVGCNSNGQSNQSNR